MEEPAGEEEEDQDGLSSHSAGQAPPSSASSLPKFCSAEVALQQEDSQVELELRVLEALEIYPPFKLQGIHRHFVLYGMMEFLQKSFDRQFKADEVLQLLDRFFNLEMLRHKIMSLLTCKLCGKNRVRSLLVVEGMRNLHRGVVQGASCMQGTRNQMMKRQSL